MIKINGLILSILLSPFVAYAQGEIGIALRDFSGGINDNTSTIALKPNESPAALNVVVDEPWGNLKTRRGRLTCGNTPSGNQITNTHEYIRSNGNHDLILTDNITVWATQDCVIFSTITTGLNAIAAPYFDTFRDKLWIVNKSTWVITWDGTTTTLLDGVGARPNPPAAQYVTHWKERVWVARTATEPSALYFSDLTDDAGTNIDPSLSSRAWPTANAFYIAQEDGSPIYAIQVYRDNLFVFKETGIWRIIFESVYNTEVVKSVSNVGCKFQDSIVELDNFLYFVGNDGVYKFDGNDVLRISDNITTTFKRLKQPSRLDKIQLWDTETDWIQGTLSNTTTAEYTGSVSLSSATFRTFSTFPNGDFYTPVSWEPNYQANIFFYPSSQTTIPKIGLWYYNYFPGYSRTGRISTLFNNGSVGFVSASIAMYNYADASYSGTTNSEMYFFFISSEASANNAYGINFKTGTALYNIHTASVEIVKRVNGEQSVLAVDSTLTPTDGYVVNCTTISITYQNGVLSAISDSCGLNVSVAISNIRDIPLRYVSLESGGFKNGGYFNNVSVVMSTYVPTGTFTSQISTFSALTQWRTFDVDGTLNGQSIDYSVRTATSVYNLGLAAYRAISSGAQISTNTTHTRFQWKAALATTDTSLTPRINAVTANYVEGDASVTRMMAINYNNRYMLTGSTTAANNYNDIVIVKTKAPLDNWTIYDWQISAFTRWNNNLYGGVSNSSAISRFDYGSNDNNAAINAYWTWGDQHWDKMSYKKNLKEIYGYYIPTGSSANTAVSYSIDGGTNWTDKAINMTGNTAFGTKKININGGIGNAFRIKVSNNALDESFNILGLDLWALPYLNRE